MGEAEIYLAEDWQHRYQTRAANVGRDQNALYSYAKEETEKALAPYRTVRKRDKLKAFSKHVVAGAVVPFGLLSGYLTYEEVKGFIARLLIIVGLIDTSRTNAGKEGALIVGNDMAGHLLAKVAVEIGFEAAADSVPIVGSAIGATISVSLMSHRCNRIVDKVLETALEIHQQWIATHCLSR